jgi:hypothetical protein
MKCTIIIGGDNISASLSLPSADFTTGMAATGIRPEATIRINSYDYDGPIYVYGNLLPDQVITNVQTQLQQDGYYFGPITGSIDPSTRAAIANYQVDHGLVVTATVDQPTVESLGLA